MAEQQGLSLGINSDPAAAGALQFQRATEVAAAAAEKLDVSVNKLDRDMAMSAAVSKEMVAQLQAIAANTKATEMGVASLTARMDTLGAQGFRQGVGAGAAAATANLGTFEKALRGIGAVGASQAQQAMSGLGSAMRSIPSLAIAVGIGSIIGKLFELTSSSEDAERAQHALASEFDFVAAAMGRVKSATEQLIDARRFGKDTDVAKGLEDERAALERMVASLEDAQKSTGAAQVEDIKKTMEAFGVRGDQLKQFEDLNKQLEIVKKNIAGGEGLTGYSVLSEQLRKFQDILPIKVDIQRGPVTGLPTGIDLVLPIDKAIEAAKKRLGESAKELQDVRDRVLQETARAPDKGFEKLLVSLELERDAIGQTEEAVKRLTVARQVDAINAERATRNLPEITAAQRQQLDDVVRGLTEKRRIVAEAEAADKAAAAAAQERSEALAAAQEHELELAREAERQSSRDLVREAARLDRVDDFNRKIDQEIELLRLSGEAQKVRRTEIEAENMARDLGIQVGSQEQIDLLRKVQLTQRLTEEERKLAEAKEQTVQLFREFGGAATAALEALIIDGQRGTEVIRNLAKELERAAFRSLVGDNLGNLFAQLGSGLASAFSGGGGGGDELVEFGRPTEFMRGGVLPSMTGRVVDEFAIFRSNRGRAFSVAEGGGTTPEVIMPLQRDRNGNMGVAGSGGGAPITLHMSFPGVRSARDAYTMRPSARQVARQLADTQRRTQTLGLR